MKKGVIAYVWAVVAIAIATTVLLYTRDSFVQLNLLSGAAVLIFIGFLGARLAYPVQKSSLGEASGFPYLSALVLYPSWTSVLLVGLGAAIAEASRRKLGIKLVFNVAQFLLAASLATLVYLGLGGKSLQLDKTFSFIPHSAAVLTFVLINSLSVAAAIGLAEGKSILRTWRDGNVAGLFYDVFAIPIVYGCARAYVDWGIWGAGAVLATMFGIRLTYQSKYQLQTTNKELLELFVHTVEFRDPYTSGHSQRVSRYSRIIAQVLGLSGKEIERISIAALLHDVGKIHEIFAPILSKPGRLSAEERAIMELHPIKSAELVAKISDLQDIIPAVRHHHENWDGSGYPEQLAGKLIPLGSRIIMFADTIDAMTTDRPYRKAMGEIEVRSELRKFRGTQFDPEICDALVVAPDFARIFDMDDSGTARSITSILDLVRKRVKTPVVA